MEVPKWIRPHPVTLLEEFSAKYVTFILSTDDSVGLNLTCTKALKVLMCAIRDRSHLPSTTEASKHHQLIATERLHNRVAEYVKSTGAGFTREAVEVVGSKVIKVLRSALWYIDTAHQQFEERLISLTVAFEKLQGYNDYKKNQKNKPRMTAGELTHHSKALAGLLMFPALSAANCKKLHADIKELCECLRAYAAYLKKHNEKQQLVHASSQPLRDPAVDSVAAVIVASELSPTSSELQSHLDTISLYKPVCINEFAPADHF